ncbi:hypothetical protein FRC11_013416, partial [Ceratobasidium sp. 423]
ITGKYEEDGPWRKRLDDLMANLGRRQKNSRTVKGGAKHPMAHLVSEEELDSIWREYRAAIWVPAPPRDIVDDDDDGEQLTTGPVNGVNDFTLDAGVERWAKVSIAEIKKMLLIPDSGLPGTRLKADGTASITPLWHQWVAAMEMIDRSFTTTLGESGTPTLVADEVGMGKTVQSILYLQIIWHLKWLQDSNPSWPGIDNGNDQIKKWLAFLGENVYPASVSFPISDYMRVLTSLRVINDWINGCDSHYLTRNVDLVCLLAHKGNRTYFMGYERIPALPSVIVAPPTLLSMWRTSVTNQLSGSACSTLVYRGNVHQRQAFLEPDGPYDKAMKSQFPEHTIVFVEASALLTEGRVELTKQGDCRAGEPSSGHPPSLAKTIFSRDFLLSVLEEGHLYRNGTQNYAIMCTIMSRAAQRMVLTATPVFTHPRDLLNIGRLLQASNFIGSKGIKLTKWVMKMFKINRSNWDTEEEQQKLREFLLALRTSNTDSDSAVAPPTSSELLPEQLDNTDSFKAFWGTREGLFELWRVMKPYIIRRDGRSIDCDGNLLLGLLPILEITSYIILDTATVNALKKEKGNLKKGKPPKKSVEEWVEGLVADLDAYKWEPSPKIDRLLRILQHHLGLENARNGPLHWNKDGTEMERTIPLAHPNEVDSPPQTKKVVVYCHLSESWSLVNRILRLHGFDPILINGSMTTDERDSAME